MRNIETEIIINASKEKVWSILSDFKNYKNWNPFIKHSEGEMKIGEKLENHIYIDDKKNVFNPTILELTPNKSFHWLGSLLFKGFFSGRHYFEIQEISENKVKLIHGEDFTGMISSLVFNKISESTKAGFVMMNEALKLESEK
ncbi:MAG: SRPBCC family protein [Chitinophagales bacterium]